MSEPLLRQVLLRLFSHRLLAIARWDLQLLRVRGRNALTLQRRRIRSDLAARTRPLYLNLGSGPRGVGDPRWVNVDGVADRNVDYLIDFGRPLPFADASFDGVFCEHVLEHFGWGEALALAREVHRVLAPGGCLRLVMPDGERIMRSYFESPGELLARRGADDQTAMETVNSYFRQRYEHQFIHDRESAERLLRSAGFAAVARVAFGRAELCPPLALDDPRYEWESLYLEARK
jgi:predicted SAM-dependent methyltransferase